MWCAHTRAGVIATNLFRHIGIIGRLWNAWLRFHSKTIPQGAATTVYAVVSPDLEKCSGDRSWTAENGLDRLPLGSILPPLSELGADGFWKCSAQELTWQTARWPPHRRKRPTWAWPPSCGTRQKRRLQRRWQSVAPPLLDRKFCYFWCWALSVTYV